MSVTNRLARPASHVEAGKIHLPVNWLILACRYAIENIGGSPGRVAVKMNLIEKQRGGDSTWVRVTPLADDDELPTSGDKGGPDSPGRGVISDKLWRDTGGRYRCSWINSEQVIEAGDRRELDSPNPIQVSLLLPGGGQGDELSEWWWERRNKDMKVVVWAFWIDEEFNTIKELDKHMFQNAFSFTDDFVDTPEIAVIGEPGLLLRNY